MNLAPAQIRSLILRFLLVAVLYFASDRAGTLMANPHTYISPVWPAAGVSIAALYFFGIRYWVSILAAGLLASYLTPGLGWIGIPFSVCNCLEGVVGAYLLGLVYERMPGKHYLRQTVAVLATALGGPAVDAVAGAVTLRLWLHETKAEFWSNLVSWWAGDAVGVIVVLPFVVAVYHHFRNPDQERGHDTNPLWRLPVLAGFAVIVGFLVFWTPWGGVALFLIFPALLAAAVLLGGLGANTAAILLLTVGVWSTFLGHGPFTIGTVDQNLLWFDLFAASVPLAAMLLSVLGEEGSLFWPGLVLLAGWVFSGWLYSSLNRQHTDFDEARLEHIEFNSQKDIQERMATYTEGLLGSAAYLSVSGAMSNAEWKSWLDSQHLLQRHPGILDVGVVDVVKDSEMASFVSNARLRFRARFPRQAG